MEVGQTDAWYPSLFLAAMINTMTKTSIREERAYLTYTHQPQSIMEGSWSRN